MSRNDPSRRKQLDNKRRLRKPSTQEKIASNIIMFMIPGIGAVRAVATAGKVAPRILQMVRQLGGKKIAKPTTTQIKNAKPTSALRQKAGEIKVGSRTATKKTKESLAGARAKSSAKTKVKADRKPLKAPTKVVGKANRAKSQGGRTFAQAKKAPKKPALTTADKLLIGTVGLGAGTAAVTSKGPKKAQAFTSKAKEGGPGRQFKKKVTVTGPKSRPKRGTGMSEGNTVAGSSGRRTNRNAPNVGLGKMSKKAAATPKRKPKDKLDPRGNQIKATSSLPAGVLRKFQGSYNKKKEKLRNIGGKTYVVKR